MASITTPPQPGSQPSQAAGPATTKQIEIGSSASCSSSSMTRVYEEGSSIWARCPEHGYASAVVSSVLDEEYVEAKMVEGGAAAVKLQISSQVRTRPVPFKAADDCTSLTHLDDANILENLRERYLSGSIYTFTSSVLLAVNPYRDVSHLYTPEIKRKYVNIGSAHTLPPHPYALADMAYRYLHIQGNQALVISGESGAGKTETAKIVMSALADRSRTGEAQASDIQNRILNGANPILEAIGNATTKRNGNSSRFGKYNALCFNAVGNLVGAEVRTYLLESSRVVNFGKMERTYHVFYELLFGCDEEMRAELHLDPKKDYKLLCQGHCAVGDLPKFRQDAENFKLFDDGLAGIGFSTEERRNIYKCIAGIIHLGEVGFHTVTNAENQDTAACADADRENLARGAELCGFDAAKLEDVFVKKAMAIKRKEQGVEKTECYSVARTAEQAAAIQQSLLKMLYKRVFHLICDQINRSLYGGEGQKKSKHIGILDIYGFECLDQNSFEQVCINLANERLQKFFVQNVLSAEQVLYQKEGLPWEDVTLPDADPVLNCISTVFTTLDDHNARLAKNQPTTDQKFTEDCHRKLGLGGIFQEPKRGKNVAKENILRMSDGFVIQHYAGEVVYHTADFLEKNNAKLVGEAECLIRDSTNPTVEKCTDQAACQPGQNNFNSVARKYLRDLDSLMETLESCHLHYIRCFKPNVQQQAGLWNGSVMLEQMRQSGTIELVKIMHDGYPHRTPFQDLAERFQPIMPPAFRNLDARTFVETLMLAFDELKPRDWTIGMTRLFMKAGKLAILEGLSADGIGPEIVEKLKKHVRRKIKKRCLQAVCICLYLPKLMKRTRSDSLRYALARCCRVYVRLMRWYRVIRVRRSKDRMNKMLHTVLPIFLGMVRWARRARKTVAQTATAAAFYGKTVSRSVLVMWQDIASEERREREERERIAEEQRKKDEELERAYAEMLARRNKTAPGPAESDAIGASSTSAASASSSTAVPSLLSTSIEGTPPPEGTLGSSSSMGHSKASDHLKGEMRSPSTTSVSSIPTDAASAADTALRAELEKLRKERAEMEKFKMEAVELEKLRAENAKLKEERRNTFAGGSSSTASSSSSTIQHAAGFDGLVTPRDQGAENATAALSSFHQRRHTHQVRVPTLNLAAVKRDGAGGGESAASSSAVGGGGGLSLGGLSLENLPRGDKNGATGIAEEGASALPSVRLGQSARHDGGGGPQLTSRRRPDLGKTSQLLQLHQEKKKGFSASRNIFAFQRSLLEDNTGYEDAPLLTARGARGGNNGSGTARGAAAATQLLQQAQEASVCPTPRGQINRPRDGGAGFQTPSKVRIDSSTFRNTPGVPARSRRNSLTLNSARGAGPGISLTGLGAVGEAPQGAESSPPAPGSASPPPDGN